MKKSISERAWRGKLSGAEGQQILDEFTPGTHICHLFNSAEDLADILLPYLKGGIETKQFCLWVVSDPFGLEKARRLAKQLSGQTRHNGQHDRIEVMDWHDWWPSGEIKAIDLLKRWLSRLKLAQAQGFEGMRFAANMSSLDQANWQVFMEFEASLDTITKRSQAVVLCSYSLDKLSMSQLVEVVSNHRLVLMRIAGQWKSLSNTPARKTLDMVDTDFSYAEIGRQLGMSRQRVKEIVAVGKEITRKPNDLMTVGQTAKLLKVSVNTIRRWSESGIIPSYRIGPRKDRRFKRREIDRLQSDLNSWRSTTPHSRFTRAG